MIQIEKIESGSYIGSRERNEDSYCVLEAQRVFAVFDGVGGHAYGKEASAAAATAVRELANTLKSTSRVPVNDAVNDAVLETGGFTTASVVYIDESGRVTVYSVGDSPVWLLTKDGTFRELHTDAYPGSCITECIPHNPMRVSYPCVLQPGDEILICTDGVHALDALSTDTHDCTWAEELSLRPDSDNVTFVSIKIA